MQVESLNSISDHEVLAIGTSCTLCVMKKGDVTSASQANNCQDTKRAQRTTRPSAGICREAFVTSDAARDGHAAAIGFQGQVYTWGDGCCGASRHGDEQDVKQPKIK